MNEARLLIRLIAASLRAQMLYPMAFVLRLMSQFVITLTEFGALYALFARFHHIRGWEFAQIALFYGVVSIAFALTDTFARGFDLFGGQFVKTGMFDRVLLRPRTATVQLLGFDFGFTSLGRLAQGLVALMVAIALLPLHWTALKAATLIFAITGGAALFFGIFVLQATLSFWTVESLEIVNTITYGGIEAGQYPLDIYAGWFRRFLIFIVPIGCVVYFPVATILGRAGTAGIAAWMGIAAPLTGFAFLGLSYLAWSRGVAHYTSTGS